MSVPSRAVLRREDPALLTRGGTYVDDLRLQGAAFATYVRASVAHARVVRVDISDAVRAPGVLGVFTAAELDLPPFPAASPVLDADMPRPWLAGATVRYVGEPVAVVVTEDRYQGPDAADLVVVDYEPLPALVDVEEAIDSEVLVHPEAGTNVALELAPSQPEDSFLDGCEVVVHQRIVNQRLAPCPLEVRAAAASWGSDGRLTQWASSQGAHAVKDALARGLGLPAERIRVVTPDVGGGFGAKADPYAEELLVAWLARRVGRPVRWVETRSESMVGLGHGRAQLQDVTLGGRRDGTLLAYRLRAVQDAGAYPTLGATLPMATRLMATGAYRVPKLEFSSRSVVTNTNPVVAYRGAGMGAATAAIERAVDLFAAEIGMDAAELRSRNLVGREAFPYLTPSGATYDSGDYQRALDAVLAAAEYNELRAEQTRRRTAGDAQLLGIGMSVYVGVTNRMSHSEYGGVEVRSDGSVLVRTGSSAHGQGHATTWATVVSRQLGVPVEQIDVVHGDTDVVPRGSGTGGSRSLQLGGVAVHKAAAELAESARHVAAELLEASPDDVVLDTESGRFHVAGAAAVSRTWAEIAAAVPDRLVAEVDYQASGPTFPFGAHVAVVEVDGETGQVELLRLVAVDDAGTVIDPVLVEGQAHGGLAQGAAQALFEEVRYDGDGNPLTTNLADYAFPSSAELPSFETLRLETPTPHNPLGAKGIGESATIGSTPAVHNAVVDAVAHLGVRHLDMPATPERVWRAIRRALA